jgi:hypothetical protein
MKQYILNGVTRSGRFGMPAYINLDVYTGAIEGRKEQGLAYAVVMKMMDRYFDKNHVVVMDNFFTSVPLFLDLLTKSTYACGTVRLNRKFLPKEYGGHKDMSPGDSILAIG